MLLSAASNRRFCALQLFLALAQRGGALLDQALEAAVELVEFLDHQRDRAVGAPAVAVGLLVGRGDEPASASRSTSPEAVVAFASCLAKSLCTGYPAASVIAVTVMVWLWSSQTPEAPCGEISP